MMFPRFSITCVCVLFVIGCQHGSQPQARPASGLRSGWETRSVPAEAGIVKLLTIWQADPFIRDPADGVTPIGFRLTLYLINEQQRGVFGNGTIRLRMVLVERDPSGKMLGKKHVQTWQWNTAEAVPFRSKRVSYLGWGYGLLVSWDSAEVPGKEVEIHPEFVRRDNRLVTGSVKSLKVPPPLK